MAERHSRQSSGAGSAGFKRYPPAKGGRAHVSALETISAGGCWCGEKFGHDWPGKAEGEPHPRGPVSQRNEETMSKSTTISRSDMNRFGKGTQDLILYLVNAAGVEYRTTSDGQVLLYPPDGVSRPFKLSSKRPDNANVDYITRQFMASYSIPGEDGVVPGSEPVAESPAEAPAITTTTYEVPGAQIVSSEPEESEAHRMVRSLAKALGVTIGGVAEDDYLAILQERDDCATAYQQALAQYNETQEALSMTIERLTQAEAEREAAVAALSSLERKVREAREVLS